METRLRITFLFRLLPAVQIHIHFILFIDSFTGTNEPNKLTCSQLNGFIAHLVQPLCIGIAGVIGSNPIFPFSGVYKTQLRKDGAY